jgi:GntR family transcriptional regulator of arabinose operon
MNNIILKIYKSILSGILDKSFPPGTILPPETKIAENFNTNRMNAHFAVKKLEKLGLVSRKKRVGTRISPNIDLEKVGLLLNEMNRSICILYSMTPHWVHWNEASFTGIEEIVEPEGYSITYQNIPTGQERAKYKKLLAEITGANASALVIFPDSEDSAFMSSNADLLRDLQIPIFMVNRSGEPMPMDMVSFVSMDPFGEGVKVGSILRKNNYQNIIMITDYDSFWGIKRLEGLQLGLKCGNKAFPKYFESSENGEEDFARAVEKIRSTNDDVVIVPAHNEFAAQFIDFAAKKGLKPPKDYKLITCDDNPLYKSYNLTSLAIPMKEVGQVLGKLICDKSWLSNYRGRVSVKINSVLIVRDTFKPKII